MLFGIPSEKMPRATFMRDGIIRQALRKAKTTPDVLLISDVCFCEYTDHGQCGIVSEA